MVDLRPFQQGIDAARNKLPDICQDPRAVFHEHMTCAGYSMPEFITPGRLTRVDAPEDKKGKKSGWFIYHEIEDNEEGAAIGIAKYGDWRDEGDDSQTWTSKSASKMTFQERARHNKALEDLRQKQKEEAEQRQHEAAQRAFEIWSNSQDASPEHPYLKSKGVYPRQGVKQGQDGRLIIPMAFENQIVTLEYIFSDGSKRRLTGGRAKGAWFKIEGQGNVIYIAEGYATADSLHQATNAPVYVAFNAHNLYEVASYVKKQHKDCHIVIAADGGNVGRTKAQQAADGLDLDWTVPESDIDFNDMHMQMGLDAVTKFFQGSNKKAYQKEHKQLKKHIAPESGVLEDIYDYYNATSGNEQRGFAVQTALALCSIVLGRSYATEINNYASLYLLNVGKSGTGKEHPKTVIEKILYEAGLNELVAGDGYTSAGAVFSDLLDKPRHITIIDEFGRYLEAGRDMNKGNQHQREANTKLMEAIGRCQGILRPPTYSTMTLKKEQANEVKNRQVYNPAITLMGMTTPDTLFKVLDMGAIKDGFINRFIISVSDAERTIRKHKPMLGVPQSILDWIRAVEDRANQTHIATEPANPVVLNFSEGAMQAQEDFQWYCVDQANNLEKYGMAELPGRSNEMALRIALINELSKNPYAETVTKESVDWAISYVKSCLDDTIERLKISISSSEFESYKKEILNDLRERGESGITWRDMQKTPPYSQHKQKELKEILAALKDADLAVDEPYNDGGRGRPTTLWVALA